ncbi:MAG: threonine/serine dehydratase [Pseudomonadota bacterium]
MSDRLPTVDDVHAAARRLSGLAVETPLVASPALDARGGGRVLLKLENLQRVGAFKFRGAYNCISQVDRDAFPGGVVACSSGNHAQGVAAAAALLGHASRIVMPSDAPAVKVARTRAFGGEVVPYDRVREDREAIARALAREHRAAFIHPYDDPLVIAGQGTVGLEIVRQAEAIGARLDAVLVPCSGGGLSAGIALAVKEALPACEVVTVEPEGFDDFARSLAAGRRLANSAASGSIADALMAVEPGRITFEIAARLVARGVAVSDAELAAGVRFAFAELKQVVEPGGAAALAAILVGRYVLERRTVAVVISGGNIDAGELCRLLAEP